MIQLVFFDNRPNLWTHDCSSQETCDYQVNDICQISGLNKKNHIQEKMLSLMAIVKNLTNLYCNDTKTPEDNSTERGSSDSSESSIPPHIESQDCTELILDVIEEKKPREYDSVILLGNIVFDNKWIIRRNYCRWRTQTCTNRKCLYAHSFEQLTEVFSKQKVVEFYKTASIKLDNQEKPVFFILRRLVGDFKCTTKDCTGEMDKEDVYMRYYNNVNNLLRYPDYVSRCLKCSKKLVLSVYI